MLRRYATQIQAEMVTVPLVVFSVVHAFASRVHSFRFGRWRRTNLQRLARPYVLLVVVNALLQQLLQLLLHLHDRHDVALQTRYQQHDLVYDVFAMTQ